MDNSELFLITEIFATLSVPMETCFEVSPTPLTVSEAPTGTEILKFPLTSAAIPVLEPVTLTEAPSTGTPLSSITVPVTILLCENAKSPLSISNVKSVRNFLMCKIFFNF